MYKYNEINMYLKRAKGENNIAKNIRTVSTRSEFENTISVYNANGFKIKSKSDNEVVLVKKTRSKKWSLTGGSLGFIMIIPRLVILCCTLFTWPFIYNKLHTKVETATVRLVQE